MATKRVPRILLPVGLLVLAILFVRACVPDRIADLRVLSVARIPATDLPRETDFREGALQRGGFVWKISLSGDANWIDEVREHELNGYAVAVRCDDRDRSVQSFGPFVGETLVSHYGESVRSLQPKSGTEQYDVYLPETGRYRSEADFNAPMPSYDLARERMTLCVRIGGGAMHGASARSNEVRVDVGGTP